MMARILMKIKEFKSKMPIMESDLKFGIMISGILNLSKNYFPEYDKDVFKMLIPYEQPILYMYGKRDPMLHLIE